VSAGQDQQRILRAFTPAATAPGRAQGRLRSGLDRLRAFWFGETDLRPLGLFRLVFGLLLVNYFWQLIPHAWEWYSDAGMMPRPLAVATWPQRFSLLFLVGESWQVVTFLVAAVVASVALAIGYRTRAAAVLVFVALVSVQWRNALMIDGSDYVYRVVAFWLIFAGAGACFSLDSILRRSRGGRPRSRGWALPVRILELQVAWVYLTTALEKFPGQTWFDGTAAYWALQLRHTFGREFAEPLALNASTSWLISTGTIAVELSFLPLVFFPLWNRAARDLAVVGGLMLHGGILVLMNVGNFPVIMIACLLLLVPGDRIARLVRSASRVLGRDRRVIYYDKACACCRATVGFLRAADPFRTVRAIDIGRTDRLRASDSSGRPATGLAAIALLARGIPLLGALAGIGRLPAAEGLVEAMYPWAGKRGMLAVSAAGPCDLHRHIATRAIAPRAPWRGPGAIRTLLLASLALMALGTAVPPHVFTVKLPGPIMNALAYVTIDQRWNMFSPNPPTADGWLSAPARLADGTTYDLLTGGTVSDAPRYADPLFSRWTKGLQAIVYSQRQEFWLEYGRMFCRARNLDLRFGQSPLATFEIKYHERIVAPPPGGQPTYREFVMWRHAC
jgi:predicted DCC family thiol-disulfide oxidoreductase YuxK